MKEKSLKSINDYIFRALEKLDKNEIADASEIKRCNAISQAGKTIVSTIKIELEIAKMKENKNKYVNGVESKLGLDNE